MASGEVRVRVTADIEQFKAAVAEAQRAVDALAERLGGWRPFYWYRRS